MNLGLLNLPPQSITSKVYPPTLLKLDAIQFVLKLCSDLLIYRLSNIVKYFYF